MIAPWIIYALINTFFTSFAVLNFKYLTAFSENLMVTLSQCFVITGIICAIYLLFNKKETLSLNKDNDLCAQFHMTCLFSLRYQVDIYF